MCTSLAIPTPDGRLFGRTLDLDSHFGEHIALTPRRYPFSFRDCYPLTHHYALLGTAAVIDGYPLYAEAMNEKGLCMAGLRFAESAVYAPHPQEGRLNLAPWELIPYLLSTCATVYEAKDALEGIWVVDKPFSEQVGTAPLHWHVTDADPSHEGLILEVTAVGMSLYRDETGVLTNEPPFPMQLQILRNFLGLSPREPACRFSPTAQLRPYSRGMGAMGLPGDLSSASRFVRVAFVRENSVCEGEEAACVSQVFHILGSVAQQRGCCQVAPEAYEVTRYSVCCNTSRGVYYYTTYQNSGITAVDMGRENLGGAQLRRWPLLTRQTVQLQNG